MQTIDNSLFPGHVAGAASSRNASGLTTALPGITSFLEKKRQLEASNWRRWIEQTWRKTSAYSLLTKDPITWRSALKPRGYSGDAVLLDMIYKHHSVFQDVLASSEEGKAVFAYTSDGPASRAVRNRRRLLACKIDSIVSRGKARILSLACGHLREITQARHIRSGTLQQFVAIDQDPESLRTVARDYAHLKAVEPIQGTVRQLLRGRFSAYERQFDFCYAAGLYDYLSEATARTVTRVLFQFLRPDGILWYANFLPGIPDRGYMESTMDWWLTFRTKADIYRLSSGIEPEEIAASSVFVEPEQHIAIQELVRK